MAIGLKTGVLLLLFGACSGAGGGLLVWLLVPVGGALHTPTAEKLPKESSSSVPPSIGDFEARLLRVEKQTADLQRLLRFLSLGAGSANTDDADAEHGDAGTRFASVVDSEDPVFDYAVRSVLDRVEWEREEERRVVGAQRRVERAQRQTDLLTAELGLSPEQRETVGRILVERMEAFNQLRSGDAGSEPATRGQWRHLIAEQRRETEEKLSKVLEPEQLRKFQEFQREEGLFGGGRGARRGDRSPREDQPREGTRE